MTKLHKNHTGFSVVEFLLALVTLALVGAASFFVAKHIYRNKPVATPATSAPVTKSASPATPTATTDPNQGYLVIKEWGVRIKQPASPISYTLGAADADGNQGAFLTNSDLEALPGLQPDCHIADLERVTTPPSPAVLNPSIPDQNRKLLLLSGWSPGRMFKRWSHRGRS